MLESDQLNTAADTSAAYAAGATAGEESRVVGRYVAQYFEAGELVWEDHFNNLVTDVGARDMLDKYLSGSGYTAASYIGLIGSGSYTGVAAGDTAASHAGWLECGGTNAPAYSQTARQTAAYSAASGRAKSTSAPVSYSITSSGTVKGCFLSTSSTKDGTTGVLFSAGLFSGGDQVVSSGGTLQVSYQLSV